MRTEKSPSVSPRLKQALSHLSNARRSFWARGPAVRWLTGLGVLAILAGVVYLTALTPTPGQYLADGRQYSADALELIYQALDEARISYRVDDRRVSVATENYAEASALVSNLKLSPRSISEIRKSVQAFGIFDSLKSIEQREHQARVEELETMIGNLDGIITATVSIERSPSRSGGRPVMNTTAFVYLEVEPSRDLSPKTVQSIKGIIVGKEPTLKADAIAVYDRKGHRYLDPMDPALDEISRTKAREEELAQELREEIPWIEGATIDVQLVASPEPSPQPVVEVKPERAFVPAEPLVAVNQPLEAEPQTSAVVAEASMVENGSSASASEARLAQATREHASEPVAKPEFARVWVKVPRSFYYRRAWPNRDPSQPELQRIQERTEKQVRRAAQLIFPAENFELTLDTFPDKVNLWDPRVAPAVPETRRIPSWWVPALSGAGIGAVLLVVGLRLLASRAPRKAAPAETSRITYTVEEPADSGPGPSERVRELIRHNPEAAASVLNRWIGKGGHAA